ncbi:MAG: ferric reductase-like transmembrane domain-containing protein [Solirubrobacteraceae bacterium]
MGLTLAAATLSGPSAYWYLTRGTGAVSLVLLTVVVVLGIMGSLRFSLAPRWPRFVIDTIHRDVSLLAIGLLVVHVLMSVLDSFAPISLINGVIPFTGTYRPLWLGLGALSFDLMLAIVVTSLVRRRLGYRWWRGVHWLAYASWPIAVLHGLGTGSDTKVWWMLLLTFGCLLAVLIATAIRIARETEMPANLRGGAGILTVLTPLGVALFTLQGPLQKGWAKRAGTPTSTLVKAYAQRGRVALVREGRRAAGTRGAAPAVAKLKLPFSATVHGTVKQSNQAGGTIVDLALKLSGGADGRLRVRLAGSAAAGGGLSMAGSQVDLLASGLPSVMEGQVVQLQGQQFLARVSGASGSQLNLLANLSINSQAGTVSGTVSGTQVGTAP